MTTFGKVAIVTSALGTLGGGAVLANNLLSKPEEKSAPKLQTISEKLIEEGFDTNVGDQWQTILDAYNKVKDSNKIFNATKLEKENLAGLRGDCNKLLGQNSISDKDYKKVKQWCVKPETIETILKRGKYDLLDTTASKNEQSDAWWKNAQALKLTPNSFPTIGAKMKGTKDADIQELKKACAELKLNEAKTIDEEFDSKLERGKAWCSKQRED